MKKIIYICLFAIVTAVLVSCEPDREDYDPLSANAAVGGVFSPNGVPGLVPYVIGADKEYSVTINLATPSPAPVESIDVLVKFNGETVSSNTALLKTVNVPAGESAVTFNFTYEELIAGLTLNGADFPADDAELAIGESFTLSYLSNTSAGNKHASQLTSKVAVGTRFAGSYRTLDAEYYRLGELNYTEADWPEITIIESVDLTTYRVVEYFGAFEGNEWYFQIDENDNITYPEETPEGDPQLGNGEPFISCPNALLTNVPCDASTNYVERDETNGADKLYMSFGYNTLGGPAPGPREFYHVLEKIVE